MELLRTLLPAVLAMMMAFVVDHLSRRRGLLPPGFQLVSASDPRLQRSVLLRRTMALTVLWLVFWIGVFAPLGSLGHSGELDLASLTIPQLFLLHALFAVALAIWYALGFAGYAETAISGPSSWMRQFGFRTGSVWCEIGLGLVAGVAAWVVVLALLLSLGGAIWWLGGDELLPRQPPPLIPWVAALPIAVRLGISVSAGVVEETFFRGFLQPRVGIILSTFVFVLAHASYEQPLMLVGITVLSLIYAFLVRWRQNIWPAIAAHALFDALQLLLIIPLALRVLPGEGEDLWLPVAKVLAALGRGAGG